MEELLDILLTAGAPSGYEGAVQDIFRERMGRYVDRVEGTEGGGDGGTGTCPTANGSMNED